jgi:hypothetical protein
MEILAGTGHMKTGSGRRGVGDVMTVLRERVRTARREIVAIPDPP